MLKTKHTPFVTLLFLAMCQPAAAIGVTAPAPETEEPPTVEQPAAPSPEPRAEDPDVWTCLGEPRVWESRMAQNCLPKHPPINNPGITYDGPFDKFHGPPVQDVPEALLDDLKKWRKSQ
jgi:hypothetical protein